MREIVDALEIEFQTLHRRTIELIGSTPADVLFAVPAAGVGAAASRILRSAAAVEQAFGGITTRLWDDPF